jgi:hypothetical protein
MNGYDAVDRRLDQLAQTRYTDSASALAALAEATGLVNEALAADPDDMTVRGVVMESDLTITAGLLRSDDLRDRLRRWIEKLREAARVVARQFSALSYSVSVSFPGGVSVGVTWATS